MQPNNQNKKTIYDPEKHHRRSIRLKGYDYTRPGAFFVTICLDTTRMPAWRYFQETMRLNRYGDIVQGCWDKLQQHFPFLKLDTFVVMPNHMHGIVIITDRDCKGEALSAPTKSCRDLVTENASPLQSMNQMPHGTQSDSLGAIMQNYKSVSARKINKMNKTQGVSVWQRNYYEHIIGMRNH